MPWRTGQDLAFVLWLFGVPALAGGLAFDAIPFVRAAAWCLLTASLINTVNVIRVLRYAFQTPSRACKIVGRPASPERTLEVGENA